MARKLKSRKEEVEQAYLAGRAASKYQVEKLLNQVESLTKANEVLVRQHTADGLALDKLKVKIGLPVRRRLPDTRRAVTHKFTVGGHEGYLTVGMFDDGSPGELFIMMAKEGSTIGGLMDTVGTLTSIALQYGVDVEILSNKFSHQRFEPSGFTPNPEIRMASSIIDYVFRWMLIYFVQGRAVAEASPDPVEQKAPSVKLEIGYIMSQTGNLVPSSVATVTRPRAICEGQSDNPICTKCGYLTERTGKCHRCPNCGEQTGCS